MILGRSGAARRSRGAGPGAEPGAGSSPVATPREAPILAFGLLLAVASNNLITPVLPRLQHDLGISVAAIGTYVSAYGLARLIVDLPSGLLSSLAGPRTTVLVGVTFNAVASVVSAVSGSYGVLFAARVVQGVGAGLLSTVVLSALSDVAPQAIRGRVMGYYQVANNLGIALYPLLGGVVGLLLGWRVAFVVAAVAAVGCGAVLLPTIGRIPSSTGRSATPKAGGQPAGGTGLSRRVIVIGIAAIMVTVVANMVNRHGFRNTVLPLYADSHIGLNSVETAAGITVMSLTGIAVTIPGARLGDRIGRKQIVVYGLLVLALGDFLFPFLAVNLGTYLVAGAVIGLGDCFSSSQTALLADLVEGPRRSMMLGAYRFFVDLGALIGPLTLSAMYAAHGGRASIFTAGAILVTGAVVGLLFIPRLRRPAPVG